MGNDRIQRTGCDLGGKAGRCLWLCVCGVFVSILFLSYQHGLNTPLRACARVFVFFQENRPAVRVPIVAMLQASSEKSICGTRFIKKLIGRKLPAAGFQKQA